MKISRQRKFVPIAKHAFDLKSIRQTQQAVNSLLNGSVVVGKTGQFHYADGNMKLELPQTTFESFHPFKIYKPTNIARFQNGILFNNNDGSYQDCAIDATVPTDFSTPTVNPITDSWRIWAVRSGEIEHRLTYNPVPGTANPWDSQTIGSMPNNAFALKYPVIKNTDGITAYPQTSAFVGGPVAEYDDQTWETILPPLIIGDSGSPDVFDYQFSFWIHLVPEVPDPEFFINPFEIRARSYVDAGLPFPRSLGDVPIGIISGSGGRIIIDQITFDHICNRYPTVAGNFGSGSWMNFRGKWDKDNNILTPLDLDQQLIYPGDVMNMKWDGAGLTGLYQFTGPVPNKWVDPFSGGTFWEKIT